MKKKHLKEKRKSWKRSMPCHLRRET